nr:retrovirus-related Pol polyprotein from transposon TNT 1-94 [Tanacetum cinerariifolium]
MQTQTSNTLHNAITEVGSKDRPPMLAPGNYVQWKSRIKRYINIKPNDELIHYCITNAPYKLGWIDKEVPISEESPITRTERIQETYKNVSQDICNQLNAEAEAVQIILIGIDNDIFSTVDACPNACEMWKAIERSQQASTRNREKAIVNSPQPIYDQEPSMVAEDDEMSKDKEIYKLMALISLSFKKIYKPTNNNLRTSSNTSRANQDNSLRINRNAGYENQRLGNVDGARETKPKRVKDTAYHIEKMLLCKQEEAGIKLNAEQANWRDDTNDDELEDQELEAHYIEHPEQSESVHDTYPIDQDAHNVIIDSLDMSYDREEIDQNDDDNHLANERELLASLIAKLKCKIDESKNRNKFLETSNKVLVEKLKGEIKDFKNKNKILESSNNYFKESNNKLSEINNLMYTDYKKSEAELARRNSIEYASQMEIECAKKEAQIKLYKTREDKELDKVIASENKVKVLDNIVYKTGQSIQTLNMLNNKCRTSFAKPEFFKKAQRANPCLYDIGCYNDNLALMLAPESDEVIRLEKESRSKLSDLIRPFDYNKLNNLYDLFVPQREKSSEQRYFSERSRLSHTYVNNGNSKESFNKQTILLEKRMDESIPWDKKCKSSIEIFEVKTRINAGLEQFHKCLNEEMVVDLRYFNSLELQEYYYVDHMNAILGMYTELDEVTNLQCDYLELLEKCECLGKELSKSKMMSKSFESVQKHAINLKLELQQCKEKIKNDKLFKVNQTKDFCKEREQYFEIQDLKAQLQDKGIVIRAVIIKRVYYVEGLNHNLFSVGQFCNADLEVAFWKSTWYIRNLKGNYLHTGSRGTDLYSITLQDTDSLNPICLMAKATSSQAWLWHRRLSHLNFDTNNLLSKNDIVVGLPKLKFVKDHLCSSCKLEKAKRKSFHTKITPSSKRRLQLLHMDLCGPMRVASINGKRYVLVIVNDYSRYTWTHFLRSKDETPEVLIDFLRLVQRGLQAQTLHAYFAAEGIRHQTSVAQTPEQTGIVERRNRTLVEAART